ncbi:ADP-specific phosphofructokinase [Methanococcus maripaludis]|uniref:ADP-specific phosphofructokinase n=1 Tax=Methanococcus maripaludis (strain DSM 14266 / JCM 13030 / NBRC 101832 / S2 / LL) TaxID=267377 RepID=Q6LXQ3_METMP|nr:ADP-specific phosphofructokinase [Methanococcus maripaludis]CAF30852.1 ADP-dependent phosphofructokinase [Methanococcus maripaludis S2]
MEIINHFKDFSNVSIFLAYNVNVDALKYLTDLSDIEELKENFSDSEIKTKIEEYPRTIEKPIDFVARLIHAMKSGKPAEVPLKNNLEIDTFLNRLTYNEERIGGQVGIISNLLSILNLKKIIFYSPILAKKQAEMFENNENLVFPNITNGKLVLKKPIESFKNDELKINRIFEYKEDIEFYLENEKITTPQSNRFIVASRPENLRIEIKDELKSHLPEIGQLVDCAIISGVQAIKEEYSDGKTSEYYLNKVKEDIKSLKKENKDLKVHFEFASIQNTEMRKKIAESILPEVDCVGMDETEIANIIHVLGYEELSEGILKHSKIEDVLKASKILLEKYNLEGMQVHTMYYIMYLCKKGGILSDESLEKTLEFATVLASTKAALGQISSIEDLKTGLKIPHNKHGELLKEIVENISKEKELGGYKIILVPSRIVENPKSTVGLGDTISAGAFVGYVSELKKLKNK